MRTTGSIAWFFLLTILTALSHADDPKKPPLPMWREAPQTEPDSELDRLNRAFIRLAE